MKLSELTKTNIEHVRILTAKYREQRFYLVWDYRKSQRLVAKQVYRWMQNGLLSLNEACYIMKQVELENDCAKLGL